MSNLVLFLGSPGDRRTIEREKPPSSGLAICPITCKVHICEAGQIVRISIDASTGRLERNAMVSHMKKVSDYPLCSLPVFESQLCSVLCTFINSIGNVRSSVKCWDSNSIGDEGVCQRRIGLTLMGSFDVGQGGCQLWT